MDILSTLIAVLALVYAGILHYRLVSKDKEIAQKIKDARVDALNKSRSTIKGQVSEQVSPFMEGFPYSPTDLKFFGNAFDFVAIVNMAEARDTDEIIKEIVFIDIKRGTSQLSPVQRKIRDAILRGDVFWETIHIDDETNKLTVKRAKKKKGTENDGITIE